LHGSGLYLSGVETLAGHQTIRLVNALADPHRRLTGATELARHWGADALLVLVRDHELGVLRPAPGFPQTLPGGPSWRTFLARCGSPGEVSGEVAFPDAGTLRSVHAFVSVDGTVLVLIGGNPTLSSSDLDPAAFPLLTALLKAESAWAVASGLAVAASDATRRATALAKALDGARAEIELKAGDLQRALAEAARLNDALRHLNETLEQRVAERTHELEVEMAERRKAEAALVQAQKMEAVGQLTGGVAHDFNNLLTIVIGGLDTIGRHLASLPPTPATHRIERAKDMALEGSRRAATLTHRLLAFSRRQPLDPKPVDVNKLVAGMSELFRRTLGEPVALEAVLAGGLWRTHADANQLENALLNLAVNARDAMPNGGKLTIETANAFLDEAYAAQVVEGVSPGQYVLIAVTDTGSGMDAATLEKVFEPFFTTKEVGKGTGLGLSQVYGFVRQSGGHIRIYSESGEGTTVKIYLPRLHAAAAEQPEEDIRRDVVPTGCETILVVEDNTELRAYSTESLRELGYRVFEAANGPTALKILASRPEIELLFTDVVLPDGMNGRQLADQARGLRPQLKVLFTTGYTRNAIVHHGRLDPGVQLIGKPFTYAELASKIRSVLDDVKQANEQQLSAHRG
jgi:signal transduction histidine kinase